MIAYNLQFFAKEGPGGEKTEEPTSKKLSDARKEGQVAKSKEIANATGLIALFLILKFGLGFIGNGFLEIFSYIYNKIPEAIAWNFHAQDAGCGGAFFSGGICGCVFVRLCTGQMEGNGKAPSAQIQQDQSGQRI